jgi:hypothetical protein
MRAHEAGAADRALRTPNMSRARKVSRPSVSPHSAAIVASLAPRNPTFGIQPPDCRLWLDPVVSLMLSLWCAPGQTRRSETRGLDGVSHCPCAIIVLCPGAAVQSVAHC